MPSPLGDDDRRSHVAETRQVHDNAERLRRGPVTEALHPGIESTDHEMLAEFVGTLAAEIAELHDQARSLDRRLRPTASDESPSIHGDDGRDLAAVLEDAERASAELTLHLARAKVIVAQLSIP